ncbi:MAG TPA: NAD(P)/FAD-dependent oxidoreductase [Nakamurella sp.]|nr:NAD(P)/FAD-dependent oxidoreductase [Nakamurella sp.]
MDGGFGGDRPATRRLPDVRVAIVGAGFAGLGMAIALTRSGELDFVLLERAADLGGTWRDNHYPGAACDVQSVLYSYSFAPEPGWSRTFSGQREILQYLHTTANRYGLPGRIVFGAEVTDAAWDEHAARWRIRCTAGTLTAKVLVSAAGALSEPATPDLPGLGDFAGTVMHSARWDSGHDLSGERVAVIGTGASAVQIVPAVQPVVRNLAVYQRTAPWILPKGDRLVGRFARDVYRRLPSAQRATRLLSYLTNELLAIGMTHHAWALAPVRAVATRHLTRQMPDPRLRAALTPHFPIGCKRILFSNDYYPAIAAANTDLVTTGIARVRPRSILGRDGVDRPVDTLVLATGFRVMQPPIAARIAGRAGRTLAQAWSAGMVANRGTTVAGFPNLFLLVGPNVGVGNTSMIYMIESQLAYVLDALATMDAEQLATLETTEHAQLEFTRRLAERSRRTVWLSGCASWYLDANGRNTALWPDFSFRYRRLTRRLDRDNYLGRAA